MALIPLLGIGVTYAAENLKILPQNPPGITLGFRMTRREGLQGYLNPNEGASDFVGGGKGSF